MTPHALITATLAALTLLAAAPAARADDGAHTERVQVATPYIELHTGPGRGYPVFHVAERRQWVVIELRRTDWYRVRVEGVRDTAGQPVVGWVPRAQLATTLTEAGTGRSFRDLVVDDYLSRRVELGATWGRFEKEPTLKVWGAWRMSDTLAAEVAFGQVQGLYAGSHWWSLGLTSEPWSDRRLSPHFGIGVGRFRNAPNLSLVNAQGTDANHAQVQLGLRWYFTRRFVGRVDLTRTTAFVADERNTEYRALSAGLSFFF